MFASAAIYFTSCRSEIGISPTHPWRRRKLRDIAADLVYPGKAVSRAIDHAHRQ